MPRSPGRFVAVAGDEMTRDGGPSWARRAERLQAVRVGRMDVEDDDSGAPRPTWTGPPGPTTRVAGRTPSGAGMRMQAEGVLDRCASSMTRLWALPTPAPVFAATEGIRAGLLPALAAPVAALNNSSLCLQIGNRTTKHAPPSGRFVRRASVPPWSARLSPRQPPAPVPSPVSVPLNGRLE